ncbi:MAG: ATP-binding protein [Anditalea sp.]
MGYKSFIWGITIRILLMLLSQFMALYLHLYHDSALGLLAFGSLLAFQIFELIKYNQKTNEKITRFLESIQYSDFSTSFTTDSKLGGSYKELNRSFNKVIGEFKKTRAEKEEQALFLQIIIQHINTGIISYDDQGKIGLVNNAAKHLLQIPQFKDINDLGKLSEDLLQRVLKLKTGQALSLKLNNSLHLNVRSTEMKMGGKKWVLLSLQDISAALKQNELDAWQNLTKVLRHEIMNSIAPIATLVSSLKTVLKEDVMEQNGNYIIEKEGHSDLKEGLETIESRSNGLVEFVNAYRDYTSIPQPVVSDFKVGHLLEDISTLLREDLGKDQIKTKIEIHPPDISIRGDREQIQMILINLLKNAKEAITQAKDKTIFIKSGISLDQYKYIQVVDKGPGIPPNALEDIFVPFYTTKKNGSGIGLAISRQIMNMHKGSLHVHSIPNKQTTFTLRFE